MKPTKSQFEQMKPDALHTAVQSIGSLVEEFSTTVGEVESAQKTIAENFLGKAGDTEHEAASRKIADLHRNADTLKQAQSTLNSAGDGLTSATNNLKTTIQQVEQQGFTIGDDWSIKPTNTGNRTTIRDLQKAQETAKQLTDSVNAWDQADHNASQAIQKAVDQITGKTHQEPPAPTPQPAPAPQPKPEEKDKKKDDESQKTGDGAPASNTPASGKNAAEVAAEYNGKNTADLVGHSDLPLQPNPAVDKNCANFASAVLVKNGQLDPNQQTLSVKTLYNELTAPPPNGKGWVEVPAGQVPPPGAVAIFGPNHDTHVEFVSGNSNGTPTLIGSNNTNHDAADSQRVGAGKPWGKVTYLMPPP